MRLSQRRRQAIYDAVSESVMAARIKMNQRADKVPTGWLQAEFVDAELFRLGDDAGSAAIRAAEATRER